MMIRSLVDEFCPTSIRRVESDYERGCRVYDIRQVVHADYTHTHTEGERERERETITIRSSIQLRCNMNRHLPRDDVHL